MHYIIHENSCTCTVPCILAKAVKHNWQTATMASLEKMYMYMYISYMYMYKCTCTMYMYIQSGSKLDDFYIYTNLHCKTVIVYWTWSVSSYYKHHANWN